MLSSVACDARKLRSFQVVEARGKKIERRPVPPGSANFSINPRDAYRSPCNLPRTITYRVERSWIENRAGDFCESFGGRTPGNAFVPRMLEETALDSFEVIEETFAGIPASVRIGADRKNRGDDLRQGNLRIPRRARGDRKAGPRLPNDSISRLASRLARCDSD